MAVQTHSSEGTVRQSQEDVVVGGVQPGVGECEVLSPHMLVDLRPGNETGRRTVLPLPDWPLVPPC